MLNNGGFEYGLMCYSEYIWSVTGQDYLGDYRFLLSNDSHSGVNSLEILCGGSDCFKAAIFSDKIPTPPNQSYKLTLYTKCPSGTASSVYIPGTAGSDTSQYVTCNGDWAFNQVNFTAGPGQTSFFYYIYNRDVQYLLIDDVVLTYADGTVPQQPTLHAGSRNVSVSGQTLMVDGSPYLALGFFDIPYGDLALAAATGANTANGLGNNLQGDCFTTSQKSYLDKAYELGLNFVSSSTTTARLGAPQIFPSVMQRFAPHLANIVWFMADEPDQILVPWWYIPPATFLAEYSAAKPYTSLPIMADLQRASWSTLQDNAQYLGTTDVWMGEPYGTDFSTVNNTVNIFNTLRPQPIWLAQDPISASLIVPKAYWVLIKGATGIIYFDWNGFKADSTKLAAATQAFGELKQLNNVFFASKIDSQVVPPTGIGTIARSYGGSSYIFAVNPNAQTVQGVFSMQGLSAGTTISVLFENRTITASAGGFTDTFAGVARHVYVIGPQSTAPPTASVTVTTSPAGLPITVDNAACTSPCVYQWTPGSTHTIGVSVSAIPGAAGTQYFFAGWWDGGAPTHTITASANAVFTANFGTQYLLTTNANAAAGGTIAPATGWYGAGTAVSVSASPSAGYQFSGFSGRLAGTATPQTLTITSPSTVTANFTPIVTTAPPPTPSPSPAPAGSWYNSAWTSRRRITIDHTKVKGGTDLSNFPMLMSLTDAELKTSANGGKVAKSDGTDILFTAADGTTKLNHELESYNGSAGSVVSWVRIPALSATVDTVIYLYYGAAGVADQQNRTGVWDSNYRVVNHMSSTPTDSTQYANNATVSGGAAFTPNGEMAGAYSFDGVSGELTIPYSNSWNGSFNNYSVQMWLKLGAVQDYHAALALGGWGSPFSIWFYPNGLGTFRMDTTGGMCEVGRIAPMDGNFHQVAMTYDGSTGTLGVYVDGVGNQYPGLCKGPVSMPGLSMSVGGFANQLYLQSTIDELRLSANATRTAGWIGTEYNNQRAPSTFYSVAATESQ